MGQENVLTLNINDNPYNDPSRVGLAGEEIQLLLPAHDIGLVSIHTSGSKRIWVILDKSGKEEGQQPRVILEAASRVEAIAEFCNMLRDAWTDHPAVI